MRSSCIRSSILWVKGRIAIELIMSRPITRLDADRQQSGEKDASHSQAIPSLSRSSWRR